MLSMPGDPHCRIDRTDGFCSEVDEYYDFPDWDSSNLTNHDTQGIAQRIFEHINIIRDDPPDWFDTYSNIEMAEDELDQWPTGLDDLHALLD